MTNSLDLYQAHKKSCNFQDKICGHENEKKIINSGKAQLGTLFDGHEWHLQLHNW